ncbi:hypothetical protein JN531_011965 [Flagellatimonas centrodinii]|uniref:hypothetical protein n=1 Tax=Flagellatimonas centrodinii TaxID=2806210 RepID=UPI001FEF9FF1|nr:hypothetical protein [Flagellatimonas centrodinii]ULQ45817.1 hypothetical protein JN531_011965 [Flagellatimonas centrodinii]
MAHDTELNPEHWITLREWDERRGHAKGTAFRAFKRWRPRWRENRDYRRLDAQTDAALIASLKCGNRLYISTVHAVLLSPAAAASMDDPAA